MSVKIQKELIVKANEIASSEFDYDSDNPITSLADALTIFTMQAIEDDTETDSSEVYDLINNSLKD